MTAVIISRPTQPWGYVIPLGTKTYPGPLNRRRIAGITPPPPGGLYPIYATADTVYESGVYLTEAP